jgi:serine/threonine-protein kinase
MRMSIGPRVWRAGKALLLVGALGATFLVFFFIAMRVAMSADQVQVPDLGGSTIADATRILGGLGLELRDDPNRRPHDEIPAGHVMQQDPPAGVGARPGRTIRVWLSSGPRAMQVPELVAQPDRTARMRLEQQGLEVATVSEFRSPEYPSDSIVAQQPPPGSNAPHVTLLVNRGEPRTTYVMPDVIGMPGDRVESVLRSHGFRVTIVGSLPYAGVPPGVVVRQQPAAGFQVGSADAISLEVSR